ncbi:MAG: acetolactate synthase small subunit [archaeon]|nr:acetolactate synthase small subunit [archaeon]
MIVLQKRFFIKMIVDNDKGVMARIATLLARKGYNIKSVCVGSHLEDGEASIILIIMGDPLEIEVAKNMLGKLVNVISIELHEEGAVVEREDILLKVKKIPGLAKKIENFGAKIALERDGFAIIELLDSPKRVEELIEFAKKELEVADISRSGANAMAI